MPRYQERVAGIYRCQFQGTDEREFDTEEGGREVRWVWRFQELSDPTSVGQIDKITGTSLKSPNSNAHKMASGIMGHKLEAGDDTDTMIGRHYDVVYGPNQAGNLTITSVVLVPLPGEAAAPVPVAAAAPAASATTELDDLPF